MKEEISDFLRNLYASGAISDLHEAFEEYPVEEEWHKGKLENVLCEEREQYYTSYEEGDIVFVKEYEYTDGKKGYNHLFVIIERNAMAVPIECFAKLHSYIIRKQKHKINELIKEEYTLSIQQIICKAGTVCKELLKEYKDNVERRKQMKSVTQTIKEIEIDVIGY